MIQETTAPPGGRPASGKEGALAFIAQHGETLLDAVLKTHPPLYDGVEPADVGHTCSSIGVDLLPGQRHALAALWTRIGLLNEPDIFFVGEMSVGKTYVSLALAHLAAARNPRARVLVLCPTHLLHKWRDAAHTVLPGWKIMILRTLTQVDRHLTRPPAGPEIYILSKETAKLGSTRVPAFTQRRIHRRHQDGIEAESVLTCPHCGGRETVHDPRRGGSSGSEEEPRPASREATRRSFCADCRQPLWTWKRSVHGGARYPLADYIGRRRVRFTLLFADEAHQYKGGDTAQGSAFYRLRRQARHVVLLTGTIVNGYASSLFHLLYRCVPEVSHEFKFTDTARWVNLYGFVDRVFKHPAAGEGVVTRRHSPRETVREKAGISPLVFKYLLERTVFLSLKDVIDALPSFEEIPVSLTLPETTQALYGHLETAFRSFPREELDPKARSTFLQVLLSWPDNPWREEQIATAGERILFTVPTLDSAQREMLLPKEQKLIEIARADREAGRKTMVFPKFTARRDVQPRLAEILTREGLRVAVLRSHTVSAEARMEWIEKQAPQCDVILANPQLVELGLDLLAFPTLVFFQPEYNLYTLRQASRRSWRIGQEKDVRVYYLYYADTAQERATALCATKLQAALTIDGESIPERGLAAGGEMGILGELGRSLMRSAKIPNIRALFQKTRHRPDVDAPLPAPHTPFRLLTGGAESPGHSGADTAPPRAQLRLW